MLKISDKKEVIRQLLFLKNEMTVICCECAVQITTVSCLNGERRQETAVIVSEAVFVQCFCYDSERYT